jgi:hypothetical protein
MLGSSCTRRWDDISPDSGINRRGDLLVRQNVGAAPLLAGPRYVADPRNSADKHIAEPVTMIELQEYWKAWNRHSINGAVNKL